MFLSLAVLLAVMALFVSNRHLEAHKHERERHFVTIHFIAAGAVGNGETPKDLEGLLKSVGGETSPLMKPFPGGLVFRSDGDSFTLEEPWARNVTLLEKDRLIGSDRKWPRWQSSGEYGRKFPDQQVPPSGYE
ncbi:hypothetical protein [Luteolibacter flavescens]|uniref:hypothetical protein n=1 Tax=Luteolibacter flavescens TaxID=1859460 RepID=UPI0022213F1A|nr:hypothetical protein [Luteolibacter flavescens]